jgi:hypothetical protein
MAHFYATCQGNRGETSRTGSKSSGIVATASGWDIGGSIYLRYDPDLNTDVISLEVTHGSNRGNSGKHVITFAKINGELTVLETDYPELLV